METIKMDVSMTADDQDLREVIENNFLEGDIRVSFARHPNFFHSVDILGFKNDVMVARNNDGRVVGYGIRSLKKVFVNGESRDIGYLSGLRLNQKFRGGLGLARAYQFFKKLHQDGAVPFYFTTIVKENLEAISILTSQKGRLPAYESLGAYNTYAVHLPIKVIGTGKARIRTAESCDLEAIAKFVNSMNVQKQFSPVYDKDFADCPIKYRGLRKEDIYVAWENGEIIGVAAKWDQKAFKQNIIVGYSRKMQFYRFFFNLYARCWRISPLPKIGCQLNSFYLSFLAIKNNDETVFRSLIERISQDNLGKGYMYFLIGLSPDDPLATIIGKLTHTLYEGIFFRVYWKEEADNVAMLDGRTIFHELALM